MCEHCEEIRGDRAKRLAAEIGERYGIEAYPGRNGDVVISQTGFRDLKELVFADRRIDAVGRGYYLAGVRYTVAPDWTFSPLSVSSARLAAYFWKAIRFRKIAAWFARRMEGSK